MTPRPGEVSEEELARIAKAGHKGGTLLRLIDAYRYLRDRNAKLEAVAEAAAAQDFTGLDEVVAVTILTDDVPALVAEVRRLRGIIEESTIRSEEEPMVCDACLEKALKAAGYSPTEGGSNG